MKPKPCPFCGSTDVFVGVSAFCEREVVCENLECRARIKKSYPEYLPEGCADTDELDERLDADLVKLWNRRTG